MIKSFSWKKRLNYDYHDDKNLFWKEKRK